MAIYLTQLNLDFEIEKRGIPEYDYSIEEELRLIRILHKQYCETKDSKEYASIYKGFNQYYILCYLTDVLILENNIEGITVEIVENALSTDSDEDDRNVRKIRNLKSALDYLIEENATLKSTIDNIFTIEFIKSLHIIIGRNIIYNAGEFRKAFCRPYGEDWEYLSPDLIDNKLTKLLNDTREAWKTIQEDDIVSYVKLTAGFCHCFLQIHPFSNGNGRVSALLGSVLLHKIAAIPVSLNWFSSNSRDIYLRCIRDCQVLNKRSRPSLFARLILHSVLRTLTRTLTSLDL